MLIREITEAPMSYGQDSKPEWFDKAVQLKKNNPDMSLRQIADQVGTNHYVVSRWLTGLTLNKSIEWLKNYAPTRNYIEEVKTACLWKKKSSSFEPDFCPVKLDSDPWIVQPTEHYEELSIDKLIEKNK